NYLMRETLQSLESRLDVRKFVRIHRSTVVNLDFVAGFKPRPGGDYAVFLQDGTELTLSRTFRRKTNGLSSQRLEERWVLLSSVPFVSSVVKASSPRQVIGLLFRHWNTIADTLARGEVYLPIFTQQFENEVPRGNQWAHGFMRGVSMRHRAWQGLLDD